MNTFLHAIKQKKTEAENKLTDIIKQFSNRNRKTSQEPKMASTEFHIMGIASPGPVLWKEVL